MIRSCVSDVINNHQAQGECNVYSGYAVID